MIDRLSPFTTSAGRALLRRRLFSAPDTDPGDVEAAIQDFSATPLSVLLALAPSILHYRRADAVSRLRPLPVLVLAGTIDGTVPVAHSRRLFEELHGRGELVLVEHAGHMVNLTHPREVSTAMLRLLDARGPPTFPRNRTPGSAPE